MNWSKGKIIVVAAIVIGLLGAWGAYKIMYKPHETIEEQKVAFKGEAEAFKTAVSNDSEQWQNAIVELTGTISEVNEKGVMLNETIYGQFKPAYTASKNVGDKVVVKARFVGYDDLLEEIKLDNTIILNQ